MEINKKIILLKCCFKNVNNFDIQFFYFNTSIYKVLLINKTLERGMNLYHDMFDWLGGYPFEVSSAENIIEIFKKKIYIRKIKFCGKKTWL